MARARHDQLQRSWNRARRRVRLANYVEKRSLVPTPAFRTEFLRATRAVVRRARRGREAKRAAEAAPDLSDAHLSQLARLTDHLALRDYTDLLDTCPRLVNVVSERPRPRPRPRPHSWPRPSRCRGRA